MSTIDPIALPLRPPFALDAGLRWRADLPPGFASPSDTNDAPAVSRLRLSEDGCPLGPAHATHVAIEREGRGRYSHWGGALWFSTSDGSDPNANGRASAVSLAAPTLRLLGFGSCHLHAALQDLQSRGLAQNVWPQAKASYSPRETLQLV